MRAICDRLGWRDELEKLVEHLGSAVGVSTDPIDIAEAFPKMEGGFDYNWRPASKPKPPRRGLSAFQSISRHFDSKVKVKD